MGCGVLAQAVSNTTVSHNTIRHFSYTGISLGWTWNYEPTSNGDNEVSYNEISEIGLGLLSDMGCFYHLGQDFGTKISNNVCHDVESFDYGGYVDQKFDVLRWHFSDLWAMRCQPRHGLQMGILHGSGEPWGPA